MWLDETDGKNVKRSRRSLWNGCMTSQICHGTLAWSEVQNCSVKPVKKASVFLEKTMGDLYAPSPIKLLLVTSTAWVHMQGGCHGQQHMPDVPWTLFLNRDLKGKTKQKSPMLIAKPNGRREPHESWLHISFHCFGEVGRMHVGEEKRPNFSLLDHNCLFDQQTKALELALWFATCVNNVLPPFLKKKIFLISL